MDVVVSFVSFFKPTVLKRCVAAVEFVDHNAIPILFVFVGVFVRPTYYYKVLLMLLRRM